MADLDLATIQAMPNGDLQIVFARIACELERRQLIVETGLMMVGAGGANARALEALAVAYDKYA